MTDRTRRGEPIWIELCTPDPERACAFYAELLGWTIREERLGRTMYRMCSLDGRDVAGISDAGALHNGRAQGWITYFGVDDVASSSELAVGLGGEILTPPRYLPDAGLGAVVMDPLGAAFGLYHGEARPGIEAVNTAGALCWNELQTADTAFALRFYAELFGIVAEHRLSATGRPYMVLLAEGGPIAGILELEDNDLAPLPAAWITYLGVTDLRATVERVPALGGKVGIGPIQSPYGMLQLIRDAAGHTVCLIQLTGELLEPVRSDATEVAR